MRPVFLLPVLILLACSGGSRQKAPIAVGPPTTGYPPIPEPPRQKSVRFTPCADRPCMLHAGSKSYRECHNARGERCFHFGRMCDPPAK